MNKIIFGLFCSFLFIFANAAAPHLLQPSGSYQVSIKKYQWVNSNICPDPFYRESHEWYYQNMSNNQHCHPLQVVVYYPTNSKGKYLNYFSNEIVQLQSEIQNKVIESQNVASAYQYIEAEKGIKSFVLESGAIVQQKFPLIIFLQGYASGSDNGYQNFTLNLVSHGYIVAVINSAYSYSLFDPKEHKFLDAAPISVESGVSSLWASHSFLEEVSSDVDFVLNRFKNESATDNILAQIDFTKIGGLGHSFGARSIYDLAVSSQTRFNAAAAMEIGRDKTLLHNQGVNIPFMFINAADMSSANHLYYGAESSSFQLYYNNTIVKMTPNESNITYSRHMSFTDNTTLYYHNNKLLQLYTATYGMGKPDYNQWFGSANADQFSMSVNNYLLEFFDHYLKHKQSSSFSTCSALDKKSLMYCGSKSGNIVIDKF